MDGSWGPGRLISGRYRLVSLLGEGGMGSVWRADHVTLNSPVAIKLIDPTISGTQGAMERFEREAQASAALRSPHVVQIFDYGIEDGIPYIAMELLEGESLADRLARSPILPYAQTAKIVSHVGRALTKAHEAGIVHRDLKPDNIFLVRNEDDEMAKVLDFGIAKLTALPPGASVGNKTRTGSLLGTPSYMSPEQAQAVKAVDWRSDLWSLGVITFQCVCGRLPFDSEALVDLLMKVCVHPIPVPSQLAQVPPGFDAWFARAVDRDPDRRFQSAKELVDALRAVLVPGNVETSFISYTSSPLLERAAAPTVAAGPAARSNTVAGVSVTHPSSSKSRTALWIGAGALALGVLGTTAAWLRSGRGQQHAAMVVEPIASSSAAPQTPPANTTAAPDVTVVPVVTAAVTVTPEPSASASASAPAKAHKPAGPPAVHDKPTKTPGRTDQRIGF